jgi:hypothetical protein
MGPDFSGLSDRYSAAAANRPNENPDITALASTRAHAAAPGTQAVGWEQMANAQSASGRASPTELAQAAASARIRQNPNR